MSESNPDKDLQAVVERLTAELDRSASYAASVNGDPRRTMINDADLRFLLAALAGNIQPATWSMGFDEVEDLHSRISGVIWAQERWVSDEQARWDRLMEARTSLAQWLEAQRPELSYAGGSWPKASA